jgi:hypothetical protein
VRAEEGNLLVYSEKYQAAQALTQADTQADVMVATPLSLEAVAPSDNAKK